MYENITDNEICRCCHARGVFKSLTAPYTNEGKEEVYSIMLQRTFDVVLKFNGDREINSTICDACVIRLRDADQFKLQVLYCEQTLNRFYSKCRKKGKLGVVKEESEVSFDGLKTEQCLAGAPDDFEHKCSDEEKTPLGVFTQAVDIDDQPLSAIAQDARENWSPQENTDEEDTKPAPKTKTKKYSCTICHKKFAYSGSLTAHMRGHSRKPHTCRICNAPFTHNKQLITHIEASHARGGSYPCSACDNTFDKARQLKNHLTIHFETDQHKCPQCNKVFQRLKGLKEHTKTHTGERNFKCTTCGKSFGHNQTLKSHILTHTGEKPYICDVCGRRFPQRTHLKRHIYIIHTGVKPHSCNVCQKKFSSKSYLSIHERLHTGVKPYSCEVCKKDFTAYTTLKVHMRVHTGLKPYSCSFCSRRFAQMSSFKLHERTHTGERPFCCKVCKKPFADNGYLKIHMRVHTGEKPYTCDICDKSFREAGQLRRHAGTHGARVPCGVCGKQTGDLARHMAGHDRDKVARVKKK